MFRRLKILGSLEYSCWKGKGEEIVKEYGEGVLENVVMFLDIFYGFRWR